MSKYKKIPPKDIDEAGRSNPLRALLLMLANSTSDAANEQSQQGHMHTPTFHDSGWSISIQTPQGFVGLWSCWLKNEFFLGYPKGIKNIDFHQLIRSYLHVDMAEPVLNVQATGVSSPKYTGEYKDPDKPIEVSSIGQNIAYSNQGYRIWAQYYGPRLRLGGRVWIDHTNFNSNEHSFKVVQLHFGRAINTIIYGHERSMGIFTYPFSSWNKYALDGPTTDKKAIQQYRDKFIALACRIAELMGGPQAINIDYGFVLVPEQLEGLGYENISWFKGTPSEFIGWGNEQVFGNRRHNDQSEMIVLESGNSLVPWSTIRRISCDRLDVQAVKKLLVF